ncbi:hypothetical protein BJ085DRAFT_7875, partial [Dimargaris cristalligena]
TSHSRLKSPKPNKLFVCPKCHDEFERRYDFNRHLKTHSKEKPFACPKCDQEFTRKDNFDRHNK